MTLREALERLHRAGRIASPWLPGMRTTQWGAGTRLCWENHDYWHACGDSGAWMRFIWAMMRDLEIDTSDPATVGCLAALAREASGCPLAYAEGDPVAANRAWAVCWWEDGAVLAPEHAFGDTEGEAWAAALIALAQETP